jgi:hypothetical protein
MKTVLGRTVPENVRGILYLCTLTKDALIVREELFFESAFTAINTYANIPNPESQVVTGKTYDELLDNLKILHTRIVNPEWLKMLHESI